ncbi:MAG: thioredoxin-disulfide reductase [candidate division Zixibacteria bacterium]|nr:thioredoxin-disulfide reductase [candidate division Zixibacteria bacterium]
MIEDKRYEIVIVGGGPGGLCAGMYAARARRKTVCLEKFLPGGQIAVTGEVEDYLGFEHISGAELAMKFTEHAKKFGLEIKLEEVVEVYVDGEDRVARCASGNLYRGKVIILSTGGSPVYLGVPGEQEYSGKGVSYCAICDGAFFRDQVIAVVGGGDAAVEEGTFLTKFGTKVYIIHRRDKLRAQKIIQQRAFANTKVEFIWDTSVEEIHGNEKKVSSLSLKNHKTGARTKLEVGAIFPYIGFHPNSNLVREAIRKDQGGYIITNDRMETSIKGIYACGDVRSQLVRQVTNAVGDGTTAAVAAEKYIEELEDKHALRV